MRRSRSFRLLALLLTLFFVFAFTACGDDDDDDGATGTTEPSDDEEVPEGGTLVLGAEQEPECADWISSCAGASWGFWTMNIHTMPRAFDIVEQDDGTWAYEPSILLDGEPELVTDPKQVVTYDISPDAKWSDGEAITSSDFKYTWDAIANGTDIYDQTGYSEIESVDDSDPATAVVTFKTPQATWKSLFGGGYGIYPSHILEGKDHVAEMSNGYSFSGGPWIIEKWNKGVDVTLIPNEQFWGTVPKLDKVVFKFLADTSAEFQAFKAGEVLAIYPQPQLDAVEQINAGLEGAQSSVNAETASLEGLWLNNGRPPFDDLKVRQALAYTVDRDAIVSRLFGGLDVNEASQSVDPPILSAMSDTEAWSQYTPDADQADTLLTEAGWEKGSDGIYAKDGEKLAFQIKTTTANARRLLTQQILQSQLKEAGWDVTLSQQEAGDLFGDQLPKGDFQSAIYAQNLTSLEPSNCSLFCSDAIPVAPDFSGQNWQRVNIPEVDPLLKQVDSELDEEARATAEKEAVGILADNVTLLPLDPLPDISLWSDEIVGPVGRHVIWSMFWNMNEWGLKQ